ncbi:MULTISPECIES: DUF1707 SHOCT-like domain-containing protein [unclassified Brevibacterium]|uniref:DUF1707 SHOCT-like domain-containing protein n=1 Tax=unclassified Brevibacterium TaxID=2614124 RepID=UPI001091FA5A|nr:DUF1707 domain-containing protein [Brevibacterium sp. S22]TGD31583.1 DUF1707 domain-containing protein [Brevibacterium sp. S22]
MNELRKKHDWRPSRDERAPYLSALNQALADERLTTAEHETRIARAEEATSFDDLDSLVADLPFEWHDAELDRVQKTDRRRFILGGAALLGIAAASWAGTRTWVKGNDDAAAAGRSDSGAGDAPSPETADGRSVPTDLVQVENWQKDTVSTALDHASGMGLTMIRRIEGGGDDFAVKGSDENDEWMTVRFRRDNRPTVETDENQSPSDRWLDPDEFPDVDVAALHDEVRSELSRNTQAHRLDIGYDLTADEWLVTIWDGPNTFAWTLDGLTRV